MKLGNHGWAGGAPRVSEPPDPWSSGPMGSSPSQPHLWLPLSVFPSWRSLGWSLGGAQPWGCPEQPHSPAPQPRSFHCPRSLQLSFP